MYFPLHSAKSTSAHPKVVHRGRKEQTGGNSTNSRVVIPETRVHIMWKIKHR